MGFFKGAQYWLNSTFIHTEEQSAISVRAKPGQQSLLLEADGGGKEGGIQPCKEPAQDIGSPQHQILTSQLPLTEENTHFLHPSCLPCSSSPSLHLLTVETIPLLMSDPPPHCPNGPSNWKCDLLQQDCANFRAILILYELDTFKYYHSRD